MVVWDTGLEIKNPHFAPNLLGGLAQDTCPLWAFASSSVQLKEMICPHHASKCYVPIFQFQKQLNEKVEGSAKLRESPPR